MAQKAPSRGEEGCRGSFLPCYGCVLILLVVPLLLRCSSTQCPAYRGMHKADARRNQTSHASSRYERRPNLRIKIRAVYTHANSNPRQAVRRLPRVLSHAASITLTAEATPQSKSTPHCESNDQAACIMLNPVHTRINIADNKQNMQ